MKILHTADWHIGQFKGPVVDGVNLRSQDITVKMADMDYCQWTYGLIRDFTVEKVLRCWSMISG